FVTVLFKQFQIADAVVTRARFEDLTKRERRKSCVPARAAAANDQPIGVRLTSLDQIARAVCAVIDVDNSPLTVEPFSILAAIAGAPPVVDVEHAKSAARPIL